MYTYKVVVKEIDNPYPLHTSITTTGDLAYVRNHFGLEDADVEWYTIDKETHIESE